MKIALEQPPAHASVRVCRSTRRVDTAFHARSRARSMANEVASRELRNDTAGVLRRVQTGEDITVTVSGRPVALLTAVRTDRRRWLTKAEFLTRLRAAQADPGLRADLARLAGDTTDDLTLAELNIGVLAATTVDNRAQRLATLDAVADMAALPVDDAASRMWARLRIHLADAGRCVRVNDLWIAAIAASRGLPVVTQDNDFDTLEGAANRVVIRV